jgi:hypothetical protein
VSSTLTGHLSPCFYTFSLRKAGVSFFSDFCQNTLFLIFGCSQANLSFKDYLSFNILTACQANAL